MPGGNAQDVKRRIKSVNSMEHITNAMKLVASSKLRKAKAAYEKTNANFRFINNAISEVFNNTSEVPEKYMAKEEREVGKTCYIVITGNKGLCGSFNSNVIKETARLIQEDDGEAVMVAIGSKGRDYFRKRDIEMVYEYMAPPEDVDFLETQSISIPVIEMYNRGEIDKVVLVCTEFINSLSFRVVSKMILPFEMPEPEEDMGPAKDVEYAPSVEEVFDYLVPKHIEIMLYGAIIESATCEHGARRMAMENATDNAREMLNNLTLSYNRARQAAITDEIIEIVSGAEAQK
jgi:F-type H+-transporting ATPase subunit gamma